MQIVLNQVKLSLDYDDIQAISYVKAKYIKDIQATVDIIKKSIDARKKDNIIFVYSFLVETTDDKVARKLLKIKNATLYKKKELPKITIVKHKEMQRPVVVGAGPCGLFCGYFLAKNGFNPIIIEKGESIENREKTVNELLKNKKLNVNSNIQFGEGGAGAFSDGKLTTRIGDPLSDIVIELLAKHSKIESLKYLAQPHIGTDNLKKCVKSLREEIISMGGEFRFETALTDIIIHNNKVESIEVNSGEIINTDTLVLATGHSAKDIYKMLYKKNISLEQKSFSVGVRIEHKRDVINEIQYGNFKNHKNLGSAVYQVFHHLENNHTVYSFCMCPGGVVVPAMSESDSVVVNGMSSYNRNEENSNSALCVSVSPLDFGNDIFDGLNFIEQIEKKSFLAGNSSYKAPVMTINDFLKSKVAVSNDVVPSYEIGTVEADFSSVFPDFVIDGLKDGLYAFENKMKGFISKGAILTAAETRTSSPLKIPRNESLNCLNINGLFPCGEGAGYAGGIVSAAVDGIKVAMKIMERP